MRYLKPLFLTIIVVLTLTSCGSLRPATVTRHSSLEGYRYAYINSTSTKVGSAGYFYNGMGASETKSTNPSEIISGFLMKKGFIIVPELKPENESHTIVVNYAETGRRNLNLGYAIEITIQILSATDNSLLCTGTAEGQGSTEADDIRIAINRCLAEIFK
ncbi:MAG: hypothetical protein PUF32_00020 [Prevotella sp.]|nr:hypothetical protein [Prevotella sp.]